MSTRYENVPVFQANGDFTRPEHLVGKATVDVDDNNKATITIETTGSLFNDFLAMGQLKALSLGGMIQGVDAAVAKSYYEKHS